MRPFIPVLIAALFAAPAYAAGGLDSGGGVRESDIIRVHDVLGAVTAGRTAAGSVVLQSGLFYGVSIPTPVTLTSLQLTVEGRDVVIAWSAPDDAGIVSFVLERAEGDSAGFSPLDARFPGNGPHSYRDRDLTPGATYRYRLVARLRTGEEDLLGPWPVELEEAPLLTRARVLPARPNPFRGAFELVFTLPREAEVAWRLYDVRGALVTARELGRKPAGTHAFSVRPPEGLAHGLYFLEVTAGADRDVQKVVMLP